MQVNSNSETTGFLLKSSNSETSNQIESSFSSFLNTSENTQNDTTSSSSTNEIVQEKDTTEKLVADLLSILKTGLTVEELERLQELLAEIKKLLQKKSSDGISSDEKTQINSALSSLEEEVLSLQKRLTGVSIIEAEDETNNQSQNKDSSTTSLNPETLDLELRIDALEESLTKLANGKLNFFDTLKEIENITVQDILSSVPSDAIKKMREEYKASFTDEKFEELLTKLDMNGLSDDEKKLYKSIIDDRYISDEEIQNLSYDQIKTLGKFIMVEDGNDGKCIEETLINTSMKAGTLLSIPLISDDKNFHLALMQMVKNIDNKDDLVDLMAPLTGNIHFNKIIAFPELLNFSYENKDMNEVLKSLIKQFQDGLDNSIRANQREYYQNQVARFTDLFNLYSEVSGNEEDKIAKAEYVYNLRQEILDDLISVLKTGLTKSEVEDLEKLAAKIDKLIEKSSENLDVSEDEKRISEEKIQKMLNELKEKLEVLYRRLGGKGELDLNTQSVSANSIANENQIKDEKSSNSMSELKSILTALKKVLEDIKSNDISNDEYKNVNLVASTHNEMLLREQLNAYKN